MRKWQQELGSVQEGGLEGKFEISTKPSEPEPIPDYPKVSETQKEVEINQLLLAGIIFLCSIIILVAFRPALILHRAKDREEDSPQISIVSTVIISFITSMIFLLLNNNIL